MSSNIQLELPEHSFDNTYDEVPYESYAYSQSHPDQMASIAALFGMHAKPTEKCRILELGCASGGNILPLAIKYPNAEIIGVDLSKVQIDFANKQKEGLGLKNITFKAESITDVTEEKYGKFDYIIAHGIISWVPEEVRQKMFDIYGSMLTDNGIGYISYNAFPGWNMIKSIREMMLYHGNMFPKIGDKLNQARLFLNFVKESLEGTDTPYAKVLKQEAELISGQRDNYIRHDHLEEENKPYYFHEFMEQAAKRNLQYLGDSNISTMYLGNLPQKVSEKLSQVSDIVRTEQYMDFITNRRFRSTLLCKNTVKLSRSLNQESIKDLYLTLNVVPEKELKDVDLNDNNESLKFFFNSKDNSISSSSSGMKAILYTFAENQRFPLKLDQVTKLANDKLPDAKRIDIKNEFLGNALRLIFSGYIQIHSEPQEFARTVSDKPKLYSFARYQAENIPGLWVTNKTSQVVGINLFDKYAYRYMDGKHSKEEIAQKVVDEHIIKGHLTVSKDGKAIEDREEILKEVTAVIEQTFQNAQKLALLED